MEIDFKSEQQTTNMTNDQKLKQALLKLKKSWLIHKLPKTRKKQGR